MYPPPDHHHSSSSSEHYPPHQEHQYQLPLLRTTHTSFHTGSRFLLRIIHHPATACIGALAHDGLFKLYSKDALEFLGECPDVGDAAFLNPSCLAVLHPSRRRVVWYSIPSLTPFRHSDPRNAGAVMDIDVSDAVYDTSPYPSFFLALHQYRPSADDPAATAATSTTTTLLVANHETVYVYDGDTGTPLCSIPAMHTEDITGIAVHQDALLTWGEDGMVNVFHIPSLRSTWDPDEAFVHTYNLEDDVRRVVVSSDHSVAAVSHRGDIAMWDPESGDKVTALSRVPEMVAPAGTAQVVDLLVEAGTSRIVVVVSDGDGTMLTGSVEQGRGDGDGGEGTTGGIQPLWRLSGGHEAPVRCAAYYEGRLLTAGEDSRLCLWSTRPEAAPREDGTTALKMEMPKAWWTLFIYLFILGHPPPLSLLICPPPQNLSIEVSRYFA
eukprot:gb/GECH01008925.1/.p1 GENE.gb/GECH01008925.1/~~gb/GECH01008925.1/.p1  ORF type:complete len:437 (+),score=108.43 gb/GECH01008925.1/:1-1311(+)